jgi:hypothetical protein
MSIGIVAWVALAIAFFPVAAAVILAIAYRHKRNRQ